MTAHAGPMPVPARITQALDFHGLYGPEVDLACGTWEGNPAGDVDAWEAGEAVPTRAQIEALADLTRRPPEYFYLAARDWETTPTRYFVHDYRRRGENRLTIVRSWIDWDGVLRIEQETPDRPPYRPSKPAQQPAPEATMPARTTRPCRVPRGAHLPTPAEGTPDTCTCGLRTDLRSRFHLTPDQLPPAPPGPQDRAAGDQED